MVLRLSAPLKWAYRERIRTLLAGLDEDELCFADATFLTNNGNTVEVGRAA